MELVAGAMGALLPKLGQLLKDEHDLQLHAGVRKKIESLTRELESVHAVLAKIGEVPREQLDEPLRLWARDLREASYDMEDVADAFLVRLDGAAADPRTLRRLRRRVGRLFKQAKARRRIGKAVQDIDERLREVAARRGRYTADDIAVKPPAPAATVDPRLLNMYKTSSELVGIGRPTEELIKLLAIGDDDDHHDVSMNKNKTMSVSVFGFGGLGKTTLAKAIYDKILPSFDCGAFVPVGQNPDVKKIFRDILIDLDNQYSHMRLMMYDERQLINKLQEFLQKKRCFIVIDDIWDKILWELIRCALQDSNCGSRVVVTTRNFEVAREVGDIYKMQPLSHEDSKNLLYTRIVNSEGKSPDSPSDEACDKILKKCGGVPLAIITIASLLANKPSEYWSEVYNSIGLGHGGNDEIEYTRRILYLSYSDLPLHLKPCLLYLSIFPEDYFIDKKMLIWKWVAEGFINERQIGDGLGFFELGEIYFNQLLNRSLIMPVEARDFGYIDGCRVHDMVLDLVRLLSKEENFVTVMDRSDEHKLLPSCGARRLAVHYMDFEESNGHHHHQLANVRAEQLRSFVTARCNGSSISSLSFQFLRVLAIESPFWNDQEMEFSLWNTENCLQCVGSFVHLRYLGLHNTTPWHMAMAEMGEVKLLQVLDLTHSLVQRLPESVGMLTRLLCLRVSELTSVPARLLEKLTLLQDAQVYPDGSERVRFVRALGKLTELRALSTCVATGAEHDEIVDGDLVASLRGLRKIQSVDIRGEWTVAKGSVVWDDDELPGGFAPPRRLRHLRLRALLLRRTPAWMNPSLVPNLSHLYLRVEALEEQGVRAIGRLPELVYLRLDLPCAVVLSVPNADDSGCLLFQKLRFLHTPDSFVRFEQDHGSISSEAAMAPCLESLEVAVYVQLLRDADPELGFHELLSFEHLGRSSLRRVKASIVCAGARAAEVEEAEAALAHAAAVHPNCPTLETTRESDYQEPGDRSAAYE